MATGLYNLQIPLGYYRPSSCVGIDPRATKLQLSEKTRLNSASLGETSLCSSFLSSTTLFVGRKLIATTLIVLRWLFVFYYSVAVCRQLFLHLALCRRIFLSFFFGRTTAHLGEEASSSVSLYSFVLSCLGTESPLLRTC